MPSDFDLFEAVDSIAPERDVVVKDEKPSSATPAVRGTRWRFSRHPLKYASYGSDLKGRLLTPPSADTQAGGWICTSKSVVDLDIDLLPVLPFPRAVLARDCTANTASAEDFARQQRSDDFVELHSALTELSRLSGDDRFDPDIIKGVRSVLRKLFYSGTDAPRITWLMNEAIVLTWRRGKRVDALTITADGASLLRDGQFDEKLDGIAIADELALASLVQRILK